MFSLQPSTFNLQSSFQPLIFYIPDCFYWSSLQPVHPRSLVVSSPVVSSLLCPFLASTLFSLRDNCNFKTLSSPLIDIGILNLIEQRTQYIRMFEAPCRAALACALMSCVTPDGTRVRPAPDFPRAVPLHRNDGHLFAVLKLKHSSPEKS
jgi:hypothetical protein